MHVREMWVNWQEYKYLKWKLFSKCKQISVVNVQIQSTFEIYVAKPLQPSTPFWSMNCHGIGTSWFSIQFRLSLHNQNKNTSNDKIEVSYSIWYSNNSFVTHVCGTVNLEKNKTIKVHIPLKIHLRLVYWINSRRSGDILFLGVKKYTHIFMK